MFYFSSISSYVRVSQGGFRRVEFEFEVKNDEKQSLEVKEVGKLKFDQIQQIIMACN